MPLPPQPSSSSSKSSKRYLACLGCISVAVAFLLVCLSYATSFWLYTFQMKPEKNGTASVTAIHFGLWQHCWKRKSLPDYSVIKNARMPFNWGAIKLPINDDACAYIPYFKKTPAVEMTPHEDFIYHMRPVAFFPPTGLLLLLIGAALFISSTLRKRRRCHIFVAGALFITSGVVILTGIILYAVSVSQAFQSEIPEGTLFSYRLGGSFYISAVAFLLCELSGVFTLYLFVGHFKAKFRVNQKLNENESDRKCRLGPGELLSNAYLPAIHEDETEDASSCRCHTMMMIPQLHYQQTEFSRVTEV